MTRNNPSIPQDEWLADFTDQLLNGDAKTLPTDSPDPEMRALTGTLLRLKRAFPKQELDPASVKRMQAQVLKKWREEERKRPRWLEIFQLAWLTPSRRQQFGMAFAMIAIAGILIVVAPLLFSIDFPIPASAGSEMSGAFVWIALGVLVVSVVWLLRRKP
jgi:hypothetical protein